MPTERIQCNLCGQDRTKILYHKFGHTICRCQNCGLIYAGPERMMPEDILQRYSPDYFEKEYLPSQGVVNGEWQSMFERHHYPYAKPVLKQLEPYRKLGTMFEVGCGAGLFLKAAERDGWSVSGLEISSAAVRFLEETMRIPVYPGTLEENVIPPGSFDVVAMFETIEHLFDPLGTLKKVCALLRPGGALVLSTPNYHALSRWLMGVTWAVLSPGEHLYYFEESSLAKMLRAAGFRQPVFDRHYSLGVPYRAMNPHYTHAPGGRREKVYDYLVKNHGSKFVRVVERLGKADSLFCFAEKPA